MIFKKSNYKQKNILIYLLNIFSKSTNYTAYVGGWYILGLLFQRDLKCSNIYIYIYSLDNEVCSNTDECDM